MGAKKRKVIIIGAGISGLCAGCYLQMNGYDTEIFEMHNIPGGLCTAWKRKGFVFDGCIHWLCHTRPGGDFYKMWSEILDMESMDFAYYDTYMDLEDAEGNSIRIFSDIDRLEAEFKSLAPEDAAFINEFTSAVRLFGKISMPMYTPPEMMGVGETLTNLPALVAYVWYHLKWGRFNMADLAKRCSNPRLKFAFSKMMPENFSAITIIATLADMNKRTVGYPLGGSLKFSRLIEKKYLELGGKIHYRAAVSKINVKAKRARGVTLENDEVHDADIVISAADGKATIYQMLGGEFVSRRIDDIYKGKNKSFETFPSLIQVSLGVNRTFDDAPHMLVKELKEPFRVDDKTEVDTIDFRIYNFDPTLAPEGKTCVVSHLATRNHEYWVGLKNRSAAAYRKEKKRLSDAVIDMLDQRYGRVRENVEAVDVATPTTFIRYTNNWKGVFESWMPTPEGMRFENLSLKKSLPGLKNFYMIGQWVHMAGGLPQCIMSGRHIAQILCAEHGKTFTAKSNRSAAR